jgi:hypothetical protein
VVRRHEANTMQPCFEACDRFPVSSPPYQAWGFGQFGLRGEMVLPRHRRTSHRGSPPEMVEAYVQASLDDKLTVSNAYITVDALSSSR